MNIEKEIFKRTHINFDKLINYGFVKNNNKYIYSKNFLDNNFKAIITINAEGLLSGIVIDLQINEEYFNIKIPSQNGEFVNKVRNAYKEILLDIKENCYETNYFISKQANIITNYINKKYNDIPEFLWNKFPGYGVFRNKVNKKWYGIIMDIDKSKLGNDSGEVEILNIKLEPNEIKNLLDKKGFYKAYHMNSNSWITIILDDTLKDKEIIDLLDKSYNNVSEPIEWIVPANSKYYDIINCFNNTDEIIWKQSSNISPGDIIYIYVTKPYSRIVYKCKAVEVNIPYEYKNKFVTMNYVMKLKLIKKFNHDKYSLYYLNKLGIKTIRGPRKISREISKNLK